MSDFSSTCSTCNSSPCSCASSCGSTCGSSKSCCSEVTPATPSAYYECGELQEQQHCAPKPYKVYAAAVKVENSFNMPACEGSAQLKLFNVSTLAVGAYLWNVSVGYLQIIAFDIYTGIATVQNNCDVGNVAVGTSIPACTLFTVTDPPPAAAGGSSPTGIFVAIDFTAPDVGTCVLITVTGVTGLAVGKNVQIGSGTYRIDAIPSATTIRICNDGSGITPGTPVIAKNSAGEYQYPLVLIDVNPCTNEPITSGRVLACDGDDTVSPLTGAVEGAILRLVDPETGEAEYQAGDFPTRTCSSILCCLTLVNGFAGPYIISVADSSQFIVGDILQIGTRTDRLTITAIDDPTTIRATVDPVPGATVDIPIGTSICIIECCEDLQNQINGLEDLVGDQTLGDINQQTDEGSTGTPINQLISSGGTETYTQTNFAASGLITNTSTLHNMLLDYNLFCRIFGQFESGEGAGAINFIVQETVSIDGGAPSVTEFGKRFGVEAALGADQAHDEVISVPRTIALGPGQTAEIGLRCKVALDSGTPQYTIQVLSSWIVGMSIINS